MKDFKFQTHEILIFNLKAERKDGHLYMSDGIVNI